MITMIILLNGCVKKDQNLSKKFSSNSTIISMTVTHSNKQNDSFQSDIILLDTKDNSTETITSVPYTSQYPLTYYSSKIIRFITLLVLMMVTETRYLVITVIQKKHSN